MPPSFLPGRPIRETAGGEPVGRGPRPSSIPPDQEVRRMKVRLGRAPRGCSCSTVACASSSTTSEAAVETPSRTLTVRSCSGSTTRADSCRRTTSSPRCRRSLAPRRRPGRRPRRADDDLPGPASAADGLHAAAAARQASCRTRSTPASITTPRTPTWASWASPTRRPPCSRSRRGATHVTKAYALGELGPETACPPRSSRPHGAPGLRQHHDGTPAVGMGERRGGVRARRAPTSSCPWPQGSSARH